MHLKKEQTKIRLRIFSWEQEYETFSSFHVFSSKVKAYNFSTLKVKLWIRLCSTVHLWNAKYFFKNLINFSIFIFQFHFRVFLSRTNFRNIFLRYSVPFKSDISFTVLLRFRNFIPAGFLQSKDFIDLRVFANEIRLQSSVIGFLLIFT